VNDAHAIRKRQDLAKLVSLQGRIPSILEIITVSGDPPHSILLRLRIPTARNKSYPLQKQEINEVEIQLPANYPFPPGPTVHFKTPILNPNVYTSGKWCFGNWTITENLELFVIRLMKVIALDPSIVYPKSAANAEAARWFLDLNKSQPNIFPSINVDSLVSQSEKQKIAWRNLK
jgi:hypothetical protein